MTFEPTLADHVALARAVFRRGLGRPRFLVRLGALALIGVALAAAAAWLDGVPFAPAYLLAGLAGTLGWALVLLGMLYLLLPRRVARLFHQQAALAGAVTMRWSPDGLSTAGPKGTSELAWGDFHERWETDRLFAFGLHERMHILLPKRVLSPDQIGDVRLLMAVGDR